MGVERERGVDFPQDIKDCLGRCVGACEAGKEGSQSGSFKSDEPMSASEKVNMSPEIAGILRATDGSTPGLRVPIAGHATERSGIPRRP